jgi:hypothetical protein
MFGKSEQNNIPNMENVMALHIVEKVRAATGIRLQWESLGTGQKADIDGYIELIIDDQTLRLNAQVKQRVYPYAYSALLHQKKNFPDFTIVADYIPPATKMLLKKAGINYMDAAGNTYLKAGGHLIYVDGLKYEDRPKTIQARPLSKAGLKVIFALFIHDELINDTIRKVAGKSDVSLDSVHKTINALKQSGYLLARNKKTLFWNNKKELLQRWVVEFNSRLKPNLFVGTFRFATDIQNFNWKQLPLLKNKTFWGGEPAGDLYTGYLKPAVLTLYTQETLADMMKRYRLIPDPKGNIAVYSQFWTGNPVVPNVVPPLLAYTDLINAQDPRTIETAQKIYEHFLQNKF